MTRSMQSNSELPRTTYERCCASRRGPTQTFASPSLWSNWLTGLLVSLTSQGAASPSKGLSTHSGVFKAIGLVLLLLCVLGACCVYWTVRAQRSVSDTKLCSKSREVTVSHVYLSRWGDNDRSTMLPTLLPRTRVEAALLQAAGSLPAVALLAVALARCRA